jgi:hypothetical protein
MVRLELYRLRDSRAFFLERAIIDGSFRVFQGSRARWRGLSDDGRREPVRIGEQDEKTGSGASGRADAVRDAMVDGRSERYATERV